jgi:endo-alpha-1,4-polygalactosaminidase (GH114 family)
MNNINLLNNIKNFIVYYGFNCLSKLKNFDLIILESKSYKESDINYLKNNDSIVLAYLSIVEANNWDDNIKSLLDSDFILKNNEKIINKDFNTYLMNIISKTWQSILLNRIDYLINQMNFDGIFLDTMGVLENIEITGNNKFNYLIECSKFLKILKTTYKNKLLIQNNGYLELYQYTKNYLDGLCIENMFLFKKNYRSESKFLSSLLNDMKNNSIKPLFLLDKKTCPKFKEVCNNLNKLNSTLKIPLYISENEYIIM